MESDSHTLADDKSTRRRGRHEAGVTTAAVTLRDWGMSGKQGPVFSDIDLTVEPGSLAIIRGAAGSGKTSLLLSIAGRMRVDSGVGHVFDLDIRKQARAVRATVSVGHVAGLTDLENDFTVAQHIAERLIMLQPWYKPWVSKDSLREVIATIRRYFDSATEVIDRLPAEAFTTGDAKSADFLIDPNGDTFVSELTELQKFVLEFGLGTLAQAPIIVVDNIDFLRDREDRARAWAGLLLYQELRRKRDPESPLTIIVTCEDSSEVDLAFDQLRTQVSPTSVTEINLTP